MGKYVIDDTTLTGIGDAIREKEGTTEAIPVSDMKDRILAIEGGGGEIPTCTIAIEVIDEISQGLYVNRVGCSHVENGKIVSEILDTNDSNYIFENVVCGSILFLQDDSLGECDVEITLPEGIEEALPDYCLYYVQNRSGEVLTIKLTAIEI